MRRLFEEACRYYLFQDPEVLCQRFRKALAYSFIPALLFISLSVLRLLSSRLPLRLPLPDFLIHIALVTLVLPVLVVFLYTKPHRDYKSHLKRLAEESYWAVLIADAYAQAGLSTIQIANRLKEKELTLPHVSFEMKRLFRDASITLEPLPTVLSKEADRPIGGVWRQLLTTMAFLERTGGSPAQAFRDLHVQALNALKSLFKAMGNRMSTLATAVTSMFCIMPVAVYTMFMLLASQQIGMMVSLFSLALLMMGGMLIIVSDAMCPDVAPRYYTPIYLKPLMRWLPLGMALGVCASMGLFKLPLAMRFAPTLVVVIAYFGFAVPAYAEWKKHDAALTEVIEKLPAFLRDLADEVRRGSSPFKALEYLSTRVYGRLFDRFLKLLVNKSRLSGFDKALKDIAHLLPKPALLALDLVRDLEELGARAEAFDGLAEAFREHVDSMSEYRSSVSLNRWMVIFGVGLAGGIALALMGFVLPMLAKMSAMMTSQQALASMPFVITINPENMPYIASQVMFGIATSAVICGLIAGKISSFKLGEGFRDAVVCCLIVVLELFTGTAMGWV
jgi:hypothetical protein